MNKDEALRLALQLVSNLQTHSWTVADEQYVITAIKAALEAKDEPVAWIKRSAKGNIYDLLSEPDDGYEPVYTTPPQRTWVGLTDEHKEGLIYMTDPNPEPHHLRELIDVVEYELRSKNT